MTNIKCLFVWTLESVIRVVQLISTPQKLFVSHLSITWIMTHWIQGNNTILTITWITWITRFLFISCLDQFLPILPEIQRQWLRANTSEKNPKPIYEIKCTSGLCEWLLQLVTQWSVEAPRFICLCISFSHYLDQRISDPFFQTNSP